MREQILVTPRQNTHRRPDNKAKSHSRIIYRSILLLLFIICQLFTGLSVTSGQAPVNNTFLPIIVKNSGTPQSTSYTSFYGDRYTLYPYKGENIALLVKSPAYDGMTIYKIVDTIDAAYEYYALATGREPILYYKYDGLASIAQVADTCGSGCGYLGYTGIEIMDPYFEDLYYGVLNNNQYDQIVFYELGRNFWFYESKIEYKGSDLTWSITTGYAVFMRFMSMDYAGAEGGPFHSYEFSEFESEVRGLFDKYMADPSFNWNNTLRAGVAPSNYMGLGSTDLFASFLFKLTDIFGESFIRHLWKEVGNRPNASTTQDAVDNFILAASAVENKNLTGLFESWRWPVSDKAKTEAFNRFGAQWYP